MASLNPAAYLDEGSASDGFKFSTAAFDKTSQRSLLVAMIVRNITRSCQTGEPVEISPSKAVDVGGMADLESASYEYKGTFSVKSRKLLLDLEVLRKDAGASEDERKTRIHVEISEDGAVRDL